MEINNIYNEDCLDGLRKIENESIDLVATDPPYEVACDGGGGTINAKKKLDESLKALKEANIANGYDIRAFAEEVVRLQGGNVNAYFWCNKTQIPEYFNVYVNDLGCKFDILTWHKRNALPTYSNKYLSDTEYCLYFHKGKGCTHPSSYTDAMTYDIGEINIKDKQVWKHPTIKPIHLITKLVRNSSPMGGGSFRPVYGFGNDSGGLCA